jgi:hypothetical protein
VSQPDSALRFVTAASYATYFHRSGTRLAFDDSGNRKGSTMRAKPEFKRYLLGLLATVVGAAFTNQAGSMWPLALGASVSVMCTAPLVMKLLKGRRST